MIIRFHFWTYYSMASWISSGAWIVKHLQNSTFLLRITPKLAKHPVDLVVRCFLGTENQGYLKHFSFDMTHLCWGSWVVDYFFNPISDWCHLSIPSIITVTSDWDCISIRAMKAEQVGVKWRDPWWARFDLYWLFIRS